MGLNRAIVQASEGDRRVARPGDGWLAGLAINTPLSADSNSILGPSHIAGGLILRTGMTANRTDTTPTATELLAVLPNLDIGESHLFAVSSQVAFTSTLAGGTGVTASGNLTVPANGMKFFILTRTGAATFNLVGL